VILENTARDALTALGFSNPSAPIPLGFDTAVRMGRTSAVMPGQEYRISLAGNLQAGKIQFAAVLADGETFGDHAQVRAILARRKTTLQALELVIKGLPKDAPPGHLMEALRASQLSMMNHRPVSTPLDGPPQVHPMPGPAVEVIGQCPPYAPPELREPCEHEEGKTANRALIMAVGNVNATVQRSAGTMGDQSPADALQNLAAMLRQWQTELKSSRPKL
jgi:hypothetical protein